VLLVIVNNAFKKMKKKKKRKEKEKTFLVIFLIF
jgi:hypothetical protein